MKRKFIWILLVLSGIIILFLALVPGVAKRYAVKHSKEYIGRQFSIDRVKLNYFTATVRIAGFKLFEPDGKEIFISFEDLVVNLQPLNLLRNEIVIEKFHLTGLYANIIQQDSSFNFDDIIYFLNKPADSTKVEADTAPSKPWGFRMSDFELRQAHFVYDDRNINKATHLQDFSFTVPFIAWEEGESEAGVRFTTARDGYFESSIRIDPVNGDYKASVTIDRLHLDNFKEYLSYYTGVQSLDGIFNCKLQLAGNINTPEESILSGNIRLQDLAMTDTTGQKFLGAGQIDIGMKKMDYIHSIYEIDSLVLTDPYLHFILWDTTNNLIQTFVAEGDSVAAVSDETEVDTIISVEEDSLFYSLDAFIIRNGVMDYTDHLTDQPFDYHLTEIKLEADSITTNTDWVNIYSEMVLNNRGTLKAEVGFNPIDPIHNIKLNYVIIDFLLSDLNIYSRYYVGFPILLGNMYYKSETTVISGQLTSENKLVMRDVELGDKGGGLFDVPIKLALFILKDRYGVINLDVPVRGDLNDPKIRFWKLLWTTFKNLMVKVAASPFDALAGQIGADPKELESIVFNYADTALTSQHQRQLDLLLQLEEQKPGLGVELVYYNDVGKEIEMIVSLSQRIKTDEELLTAAEIFRDHRISSIQKYLISKRPLTTIKVSESNPADPKNVGTLPVFSISYSLSGAP